MREVNLLVLDTHQFVQAEQSLHCFVPVHHFNTGTDPLRNAENFGIVRSYRTSLSRKNALKANKNPTQRKGV